MSTHTHMHCSVSHYFHGVENQSKLGEWSLMNVINEAVPPLGNQAIVFSISKTQ